MGPKACCSGIFIVASNSLIGLSIIAETLDVEAA